MAEAEAPYRRGVVVADLFLFGVEADALSDDGGPGARRAPYGEGHFEAHREDAMGGELRRALAEGVLLVKFVGRRGAFDVGRDMTSHVEALHNGAMPRR